MTRLVICVVVAAALAATALGCGGSSPEAGSRFVRYHDPGGGWTADVPAGWTSVGLGPEFVRGEPLTDPTRLAAPDVPQPLARRGPARARGRPGHHRAGADGRARGRPVALAALPGTQGGRADALGRARRGEGGRGRPCRRAHRTSRRAAAPAADSAASGARQLRLRPARPAGQRARACAARPVVLADDRLAYRVAGVARDGR